MADAPITHVPVLRREDGPTLLCGLGLLLILAAEVLLLSRRYDTEAYNFDRTWVGTFVRPFQHGPRAAIVVATATLVMGGRWLRARRAGLEAATPRRRDLGACLALHLITYAGFFALTSLILGKSVGPRSVGTATLLAWVVSGLTCAGFWWAALPLSVSRRWARQGLGVLVVAAAACKASSETRWLWLTLGRSTFWLVEHLLRLGFRDVVSEPWRMVVGTSTFAVNIAPGCSGYEGIGLIWVLLAGSFWLFRSRFRFPHALLLLPIGTALIWLANGVRIAGLVAVGALGSREVALGGFHSQTGWIAFNLIGLGVLAAGLRCPFVLARAGSPADETGANPTAAYLVPLLSIVATSMVAGSFISGFDRAYPLRVVAAGGAIWLFRREYAGLLRPARSWEAAATGVAVFALWMALEPRADGPSTGSDPWAHLAPVEAAAWLVARVFGSVAFVPMAEELAFRGYLLRRLVSADFRHVSPARFTAASIAVSSLAFGALHGRWLAGTLAGLLYALAYSRRGKLGDAVLAHAVTNALIAIVVLATETWSLW